MADNKSSKTSGRGISNIMNAVRGTFDFKTDVSVPNPVAYGNPELISNEQRSKILAGAFRAVDNTSRHKASAGSLMNIVQTSLSHVGQERLENRKILELMPEVDKAARMMIASIFSPNDLARHEISVVCDADGLSDTQKTRISDHATKFFQKKLNLLTSAPEWVYQFGYETGSAVFAIIPLRSFETIQEQSYIGTETFVREVIEPQSNISLFGFGDDRTLPNQKQADIAGLEAFGEKTLLLVNKTVDKEDKLFDSNIVPKGLSASIISKMIAHESLNLTDNPSIIQAKEIAKEKRDKRTKKLLDTRFRVPRNEPVVSISSERGTGDEAVAGNPILLRLPPESVTVIHTPGEPNDHQGYLILLDHTGSPINATMMEEAAQASATHYNANQNSIFAQTYSAYGLGTGFRGLSNEETMSRVYTQIVSEHLRNRLGKAGLGDVEMLNLDSTFRCMFSRFLQQKQTRILFLPKDLVCYMSYELDQNGYGVSKLDRIKFQLGMKMAVQISRVLASIKAAMDRRKIDIRFTDNLMEQPEAVFQHIIREYVSKSTMSFSVDPNVIQTQIADKSISIKGTDIPGLEQFEITNEPDTRNSSVDFDPAILEYIDKGVINGLGVPPAAMNSLGEDEYARSVATTNLFFAMEVSIHQAITIRVISDLLRKYARYSEDFQRGLYAIFPSLDPKKGKHSTDENKSGESEADNDESLPENFSLDHIIDLLSISLPKANVAPSKAQFEALEAMTTAVTSMTTALFPDELAGNDDTMRPVIQLLRAKFTSQNIRAYLEGSGMSDLKIPDDDFSAEMKSLIDLNDSLTNVKMMLEDKAKIVKPVEQVEGSTTIPDY